MEKWTDTQNFADAGEKSTLIASAHRAAIRSIERVVTETITPHDPLYAAEGIEKMLRTGSVLALTGAGVSTESGIPDYRGPSGSLLDHRPMTYKNSVTTMPPDNATGLGLTSDGGACAAHPRTGLTMRSPNLSMRAR